MVVLYLVFWVFFFCLFDFSGATPLAYGGSQARGLIGAVATSLRQSHSNARSEPHLRPTSELTATPILDWISESRDRTHDLMVPSWILCCCAMMGTPHV